MNYKSVRNILSKILKLEAILMVLPLLVAIIDNEGLRNILAFAITIVLLITCGHLLGIKTRGNNSFHAREGLVCVALAWILMAAFGALPFVISKEIPNYIDAFFEISSGFTTTGASILPDVEILSRSTLFWLSFSHWIGGMGVLVFILAILPDGDEASTMHLLRAESPGPQVGKLVSKMKVTARILYLIYIAFTLIQFILLWVGPDPKLDFFNSLALSFATAGTGGFSVFNDGVASLLPYSQYVLAIFMLLFGVNFSLFYFILIGKAKQSLKNEELRVYLGIIVVSIAIMFVSTYSTYQTFSDTFRIAFFQTLSTMTTTGYSIVDYNSWPTIAQSVVFFLMLVGACAGSTGGGLKVSRLIILCKTGISKVKKMVSPRKIETLKIEGKVIPSSTINNTLGFFAMYICIIIIVAFVIAIDGNDLITNLSASLSCISNIGPGFSLVGPSGNFCSFSWFSKIILSLEMITGRLELFPILILFNFKTWRKY